VNTAEFVHLHPRLFHMAAEEAWPSIKRHGLLSTTAVLDLAEIGGDERIRLEERRRPESVAITVDGREFVLRDQKPLNQAKLERCLVDMTVAEWLRMLNGKVFMWPARERCEQLLNARAYRDRTHTIIEFDTARLLERHDVTVSPINAGAVLYDPPKRGTFTFTTIDTFPDHRYRKRGRWKMIAEVAASYSIPAAAELISAVWKADADRWTRFQ
jgi:hypothetical protein